MELTSDDSLASKISCLERLQPANKDVSQSEARETNLYISDEKNEATTEDRSSLDIDSISLADQEPQRPSSVVHGHIIPSGWACQYDSDNDEYKFEYLGENKVQSETCDHKQTTFRLDTKSVSVEAKSPTIDHMVQTSRRPTLNLTECKYGYHFPSSPTPSMLSELAKQVQKGPTTTQATKTKHISYGKTKITMLSDEEEQSKRLKDMFPTATGPVVDQMIKIYQGREGCIKAALISLGYKRATDYGVQQATAQSPIMLMMSKPASKKLFDKLVSYFPDKDETLIKNLMYQHKEVEHEIISILVESGAASDSRYRDGDQRMDRAKYDKNGAIMKLRYLKFLFPTCEEIELYHLLHRNYLNAEKVIEEVEKRGHKKANIDEVMQNRKKQAQQMKAQQAALAAKDKAPIKNPVEIHRNRTKPAVSEARKNNHLENLKKNLPDEASYADNLILGALQASDYNEAVAKKFLLDMEPIDEALYKQRYKIQREKSPDVVLYPCKGIQKGDASFMSITANEYVSIPREVVDCTTAIALLKVDASTYTQDDFIPIKFTHAKGKKVNLARGSIYKILEVKNSWRQGSKSKELCKGSQYKQLCSNESRQSQKGLAKGRSKALSLRSQGLNCGHNLKLVERTHPFFDKPRGFFDATD